MNNLDFSKISIWNYRFLSQLGYQLKRPNHGKSISITNISSKAFVVIFPNDVINVYGEWTIRDMTLILPFVENTRLTC